MPRGWHFDSYRSRVKEKVGWALDSELLVSVFEVDTVLFLRVLLFLSCRI